MRHRLSINTQHLGKRGRSFRNDIGHYKLNFATPEGFEFVLFHTKSERPGESVEQQREQRFIEPVFHALCLYRPKTCNWCFARVGIIEHECLCGVDSRMGVEDGAVGSYSDGVAPIEGGEIGRRIVRASSRENNGCEPIVCALFANLSCKLDRGAEIGNALAPGPAAELSD
jgi:hypothetical protein